MRSQLRHSTELWQVASGSNGLSARSWLPQVLKRDWGRHSSNHFDFNIVDGYLGSCMEHTGRRVACKQVDGFETLYDRAGRSFELESPSNLAMCLIGVLSTPAGTSQSFVVNALCPDCRRCQWSVVRSL